MTTQKRTFSIFISITLAVVLCAPAAFAQRSYGNRVKTLGHITSITRDRNEYRIRLDNGSYEYWVEAAGVNRHLRLGDYVRIAGINDRGRVIADDFVWLGDSSYREGGSGYRGGSRDRGAREDNRVIGIVESFNQRLNYFTVRDQNGGFVKIDTRRMDTRRSVNVWRLHTGDRVRVSGVWENRDTFQADRVN